MKNTDREELLKYKLTFLSKSSIFNEDIKKIRTKCGFLLEGYPYSFIKIKYKSDKGNIKRYIYPKEYLLFNNRKTYLETNVNLEKEIESLRKKNKLEYLFDWQLLNYILFSKFDFSDITIPVCITTETSFNEDGSEKTPKNDRIILEITSQTRLKDVEKIWPEVKIIQKKYPSYSGATKIRNEKIMERNEFIMKQKLKGYSSKKIINLLEKRYVQNHNSISDKRLEYLQKMYLIDETTINKIFSRMNTNNVTSK